MNKKVSETRPATKVSYNKMMSQILKPKEKEKKPVINGVGGGEFKKVVQI